MRRWKRYSLIRVETLEDTSYHNKLRELLVCGEETPGGIHHAKMETLLVESRNTWEYTRHIYTYVIQCYETLL